MTVLAGVVHYATHADLVAFGLSTAALAGVAWIVSFSTEQVGERFGPAVTGLMQSTFGNLPEFFVVLFALSAGQVVVAQTSLIGSIFANALLALGLVIVAGARRAEDGVMRFDPQLPKDTGTLMVVAVFIIVIVGVSIAAGDPASHHVKAVSVASAVCILAVYLSWVVPYVRGGAGGDAAAEPRVGLAVSVGLLGLGGAGSAFVSDWFVASLEPTLHSLHLSQAFAGIVVVAIAGNAVENAAGIVLAHKGQSDLGISVVKNSVAQIAAFLLPALVLVSLLLPHALTFAFDPVLIGALLITAIAVRQVSEDGEAAMFEGLALVAIYVILAIVTVFE